MHCPQSHEASTAVGSLAAAGGLAADLVTAQQVAEAAKKRLKLAEAALSGEVQRREVAERQLSSAQELLRRCAEPLRSLSTILATRAPWRALHLSSQFVALRDPTSCRDGDRQKVYRPDTAGALQARERMAVPPVSQPKAGERLGAAAGTDGGCPEGGCGREGGGGGGAAKQPKRQD